MVRDLALGFHGIRVYIDDIFLFVLDVVDHILLNNDALINFHDLLRNNKLIEQ